ncbi:hypothetical protein J7E50_14900 [Pedobacter sp. ISL-68]|uniref:hypothetical protein n=1 Tax=unclassified Pedobacter TaxID=2628915 RepID=UPI001BE5B396|nr:MULTISPECIES: hypothetical protein [unclassified Pedobacter]MBT2561928.1 hypothetical protein [Pedobacter sp. ISL-64]MBT2591515.1 hypothetical protein [Pedobacter sp. ISL-68]
MKHILLTLACIFFYSYCIAQEKKYTDSAVTEYIKACQCKFGYKYGWKLKSVKKHEAYSWVKKIIFISFKNDDSTKEVSYLKNENIDNDVVTEQRLLTEEETDSLFNIIYGYNYTTYPSKILVFECKRPENAILYLDKDDRIVFSINICFSGTGYKIWTSKNYKGTHTTTFGETCFGKYELLAKLFRSAGTRNIK